MIFLQSRSGKWAARAGTCVLFLSLAGTGRAAPSEATFTGCAMPLEDNHDFLTLCAPESCSLLRGKVDLAWAGHRVEIRGRLLAPTSSQPRTIVVEQVLKVGGECQTKCTPPISGRGLGAHDKPQGEGGTPGIAPQPPK